MIELFDHWYQSLHPISFSYIFQLIKTLRVPTLSLLPPTNKEHFKLQLTQNTKSQKFRCPTVSSIFFSTVVFRHTHREGQ